MNNIIIKAILVYFSFFFSVVSKSTKEIEITAASMEWNKKESVAIAIGEAKAIQGNRILSAEKIVVYFNTIKDEKKIFKLEAYGKVNSLPGTQ